MFDVDLYVSRMFSLVKVRFQNVTLACKTPDLNNITLYLFIHVDMRKEGNAHLSASDI